MKALRWTIALVLCIAPAVSAGSIRMSKHDLAMTAGHARKPGQRETCTFCHIPRESGRPARPLWDTARDIKVTFISYASNARTSAPGASAPGANTPGRPSASTLACLSCHDGQAGSDQLYNPPAGADSTGGARSPARMLTSAGSGMADGHPVSFSYGSAYASDPGEFRPPTPGNPVTVQYRGRTVKLEGNNAATATVECSTCHNTHDPENDFMLVMDNSPESGTGSPLCLTCHNK